MIPLRMRELFLRLFFINGTLASGLELGLQFAVEPQDSVVGRNRPVLLPCSSTSPNTTFLWTLDHRPLPLVNNSRVVLLTNGSLYFKRVNHKKSGQSDLGVYRCVLRSAHGAIISRPAQLSLAFLSHESQDAGRSLTVVEGDPAWLPCPVKSLPPADITWQRDNLPLPPSDRYIILDNGSLIIKQVEKDDKGEYRCTAYNEMVSKSPRLVSDASLLTVDSRLQPSPLEILQPASVTVNWTLGGNVSLACVARGSPSPAVKWTKLHHDQSSGLVTDVSHGVSVLSIHNVTAADAGLYTCVASQVISDKKANTVSVTKEVLVDQILRPPVITKRPISQEFPTAKTVRFQCEADGNPPPEIVWYRDGQKLHINGRIKLPRELVLSNTVSSDSGVYQCVATNSEGSAWAAARLLVNVSREQPRPPSRLSCVPVSATAVNLTWEQTSPAGLKAFTIHFLPTEGGEERMAVTELVAGQVNQTFTIEKLPPFTNYTFYVRSYNRIAASDNSQEVVCRTGESVPRGAPTLTVQPESGTTVLVEWTPLPVHVARGIVTEYKVQWRRSHNPSTHVDQVPGDVTRYLITGLVPDTEYEVRVLAATQRGWSSLPESEMPWSAVTTSSLTPVLPPPTVQLTVINDTTIQVRWTLVSESVTVDGFRVSYRKQNAEPSPPTQLPANVSEYLLLDLEPQTWYEVQVRGLSGQTEGEVGVRAVHTLPPLQQASPAPSLAPPTGLEATPTSPTTISLSWTPPSALPPASHFTISYQVVPTSVRADENSTSFLHSTSNSVQVTGLRPYTLYQLKVRTHDLNNRQSEYSQALECRTLEDVPEKVQEVQWKPLNTSSLRVMWKEPNATNGPIRGYTISYTRLPLEQWTNISFQGTRPAADVTGLIPNTRYSLVVRAATKAGLGSPSEALEVVIPARERPSTSTTPAAPPPPPPQDHFLGILLGCAIGGCCVILCMVSLIYRRRCAKPGHPQCRPGTTNGAPCYHSTPNHHEMQCLPGHLDSKGGHPNGDVNGLKLPLLSNGRLHNGLVTRDRNVRITENPHFECGATVSCEELRQPSDEGDSLLSGHSLNDTQLTTGSPPQLADKQEPDDGFHENHQPIVGPNG